jgi:hypothetical protein
MLPMSEADAPPSFFASRAAAGLCAAVLAGFAVVVGFSVIDHPKAAAIEQFAQVTAAGDAHYYTVPVPALAVPEPVVKWQGHDWAPKNFEKSKIDDPDMIRAGKDEANGLSIYQPREKTAGPYFIKVAIGEYLRIEQR